MTRSDEVTYTLREVAVMTNLALRSLERDCRAGRVEHVKKGRARVMTRAQVDALLAQHTQPIAEPASALEATANDADRHRALARIQRGVA